MNRLEVHDALTSIRVAADLCGIPTGRVVAMISKRIIRAEKIRSRQYVSLRAVERAIEEGDKHDSHL